MSIHYDEDEPYDGIILRTFPYAESDLILRVLSPTAGKVSVIAKGARKEKSKFQVNFDVFDAGMFETKKGRGSMEVLLHFRPHRALKTIRADIDKFIIASTMVESFDLLVHEHAHEAADFYESLALGLRALEEAQGKKESLRSCYLSLSMLLQTAGFAEPETETGPSLKNLLRLLDRVELSAERQLLTRSSLMMILESLAGAKSSNG